MERWVTPPAAFSIGPNYQDVDIALEKMWHVKERYSVQLRIECYNVFNQANYHFTTALMVLLDPSAGGGIITSSNAFGFATSGVSGGRGIN